MGCTFEFTRKRWKTIEIGEKVVKIIEEMKSEDLKLRPSITKVMKRIIKYCDEKKYSKTMDIVVHLKLKNKVFVQTPFNDQFSMLKKNL